MGFTAGRDLRYCGGYCVRSVLSGVAGARVANL